MKFFNTSLLLLAMVALILLNACNSPTTDGVLDYTNAERSYYWDTSELTTQEIIDYSRSNKLRPLSLMFKVDDAWADVSIADEEFLELSNSVIENAKKNIISPYTTEPSLVRIELQMRPEDAAKCEDLDLFFISSRSTQNDSNTMARAFWMTDTSRNLKPDYVNVETANSRYNGQDSRLIIVEFMYTDAAKLKLINEGINGDGTSPAIEPDFKLKTKTTGALWWTQIHSWAKLDPDRPQNRFFVDTNLPNNYVDVQFLDGEFKSFTVASTSAELIQLNKLYYSYLYCKPGLEIQAPSDFSFEMQWFPISGLEKDPWGVGIGLFDAKFGTDIGTGTVPGHYNF